MDFIAAHMRHFKSLFENDDFVDARDIQGVARLLVENVSLQRSVAHQIYLALELPALPDKTIEFGQALYATLLVALGRLDAEVAIEDVIAEIGEEGGRQDGRHQASEMAFLMLFGPHARP